MSCPAWAVCALYQKTKRRVLSPSMKLGPAVASTMTLLKQLKKQAEFECMVVNKEQIQPALLNALRANLVLGMAKETWSLDREHCVTAASSPRQAILLSIPGNRIYALCAHHSGKPCSRLLCRLGREPYCLTLYDNDV